MFQLQVRVSFPDTNGSALPDSGCEQTGHSRSAGSGPVPVPTSGADATLSVIEYLFAERFQGFFLLYGDVVCPSVEPESPIRELFCCDCHAVPPESFLAFNMLFFRRNGWFL